MKRKTQIIQFKINSKKDYLRLLGMMSKIEAIHWGGGTGDVLLTGKRISKCPIEYVFLRVPGFRLTYSANPNHHTNLPVMMTVDSRQVLSMRLEDENKLKIYISQKIN